MLSYRTDFFITLFRYFINLFYSFHCLFLLFLRDADSRKGTLWPFCVQIHKKKPALCVDPRYSHVNKLQFFMATEGQVPLKHSTDKNSREKSCPHIKDNMGNFIATEHIYIDISVNSAQISVEYS